MRASPYKHVSEADHMACTFFFKMVFLLLPLTKTENKALQFKSTSSKIAIYQLKAYLES